MIRTAGGPATLVTVILLKSVTALPDMSCCEFPLNTTVPVALLNVPLFVKLPVSVSVFGDVNDPVMVRLAKVVSVLPVMSEDEPLNTTVPPFALKVPLFTKLFATFIDPEGAVNELLTITLLNDVLPLPVMAVVPANTVED